MKHAAPRSRNSKLIIFASAAVLAVVVGVGVWSLVSGEGDSPRLANAFDESPSSTVPADPYAQYRTKDWIVEENKKQGTTDWHIPDDKAMWAKIEGFSDNPSINIGDPLALHVSTRAGLWQVSAYRIGNYNKAGGRLVWRSEPQRGVDQGGPVVQQPGETWTAPWKESLKIQTDANWPPGQYLLRLESNDGGAAFVPLTIRDDKSNSDLIVQSAVATWQAYNGWGGASVYTGKRTRADIVSFDRPYTGNGSAEFLGREFEMIYFIEGLGLDVSYWTDIDLHARGELAMNHRAIVIPGHDEYYTVQMRKNLETARDAGVNIGFFGANNVYRRIRLSDGPLGANRMLTNYRDASRDPYKGKNDAEVTTSFRESPAANPESSLTGSYYECNPVDADWVVGDASLWMFEGSGFKNGDRVPHMVGNEYDRVTQGVPTPANISILAHSPVNCRGNNSYADTTWYTTDSGAGVFTAATFQWEPTLITDCPNGIDTPNTSNRCRILKVTENILRAFAAGPAGKAHPSVSNLSKFNMSAPRITDPGSTTSNSSGSTGSTAGSSSTTGPATTSAPSTTRAPSTTTTRPTTTTMGAPN